MKWGAPPPSFICYSPILSSSSSHPQPYERKGSLPDLPPNFYDESIFDKFFLSLFRGMVQSEIGFVSSKEGYEGLIEEAR